MHAFKPSGKQHIGSVHYLPHPGNHLKMNSMRLFSVSAAGLIVLLACVNAKDGVSVTTSNLKDSHVPGEVIFEDNFDDLDVETWQHEITMGGGGNGEFQIYHNSRTNSYVKNGTLYIFPSLTDQRFGDGFVYNGQLSLHGGAPADECTNPSFYGCERQAHGDYILNPTMSARLRTVNSFQFRYGKVEVRAKIPAGDWLWPAIWMMPAYNKYGLWPASGEIDIMESRGNLKLFTPGGVNVGTEQISYTLHYGPYYPFNGYQYAHFEKNSPVDEGFDKNFHLYQVEWTPEYIEFSTDNEIVGRITPPQGGFWELGKFPGNIKNPWQYSDNPKMAPFDQKFYLILNLAVGGTNGFFSDDLVPRKPWSNGSPYPFLDFWKAKNDWYPTWVGEDASLQIDYVRVTAL